MGGGTEVVFVVVGAVAVAVGGGEAGEGEVVGESAAEVNTAASCKEAMMERRKTTVRIDR